jgi:hypothetical protein
LNCGSGFTSPTFHLMRELEPVPAMLHAWAQDLEMHKESQRFPWA